VKSISAAADHAKADFLASNMGFTLLTSSDVKLAEKAHDLSLSEYDESPSNFRRKMMLRQVLLLM
jgi:hypothetical protein